MSAFFEPLETRQLMSATLDNGVLRIVGTDRPDSIVVNKYNGWVHTVVNGEDGYFSPSSVASIVINAMGGAGLGAALRHAHHPRHHLGRQRQRRDRGRRRRRRHQRRDGQRRDLRRRGTTCSG